MDEAVVEGMPAVARLTLELLLNQIGVVILHDHWLVTVHDLSAAMIDGARTAPSAPGLFPADGPGSAAAGTARRIAASAATATPTALSLYPIRILDTSPHTITDVELPADSWWSDRGAAAAAMGKFGMILNGGCDPEPGSCVPTYVHLP